MLVDRFCDNRGNQVIEGGMVRYVFGLCRCTVVLLSSLLYKSPFAEGSMSQSGLAKDTASFVEHLVQSMEVKASPPESKLSAVASPLCIQTET